jgi:hypothetical protein
LPSACFCILRLDSVPQVLNIRAKNRDNNFILI